MKGNVSGAKIASGRTNRRRPGQKIIDGLAEAVAFARGDDTGAKVRRYGNAELTRDVGAIDESGGDA